MISRIGSLVKCVPDLVIQIGERHFLLQDRPLGSIVDVTERVDVGAAIVGADLGRRPLQAQAEAEIERLRGLVGPSLLAGPIPVAKVAISSSPSMAASMAWSISLLNRAMASRR